jgi:hypothetical protein
VSQPNTFSAVFAGLALSGLALTTAVTALGPTPSPVREAPQAGAVWDVLYARPFRLAEPYTHNWRVERPAVSAGYLLVLSVDPQAVVPRQSLEPVLQVGEQTAERINGGHLDGALVVIVPSAAGPDGLPTLDLASAPIFMGSPALPEQVDAVHLTAELASTSAIAFAPARINQALARGGQVLDLADRVALGQEAARLVLGYAPSESDLANGLLVPYQR